MRPAGRCSMWTIVYMAKNHGEVELLKKGLKDNDIISIVRKHDDFYEVLVPSLEVCSAHNIIIDTEI